jgi:hypothetical protein
MAHVQMSRAQAVDIIERRNKGHAVDYLDHAVATFVAGQHALRRAQAGRGPRPLRPTHAAQIAAHKARMQEAETAGLLRTLARMVKRATTKPIVPDGTS